MTTATLTTRRIFISYPVCRLLKIIKKNHVGHHRMRGNLLFFLSLLIPFCWASVPMAQRAELEASLLCYRRAPAIWDTFVAALRPDVVGNLDALAGKAALLLAQLRAHVPPCAAIERVTRARLPACPAEAAGGQLGPLRMCLNAAHSVARGAVFEPVERERAAAANARMWATREEALTYSSDAASYSDPKVREVVVAATGRKL
jgi:hypothetical protein